MFNVGGPEILVIVIVALVVLGPDQLPKAMRTFGNVMGEIRKVSNGFQAEMRNAMDVTGTTTPREKPQSGSMAAARRPTQDPIDSAGTEVAARNPADGPPAGEGPIDRPIPSVHPGAADDASPSTIDPADRAAG